ncbi:hypothetical protein L228DRAFT_156642 [Xylona heveae TC161]|uniref:Uncharacterized protein n=1 Tax=Xylona heveae (strain CBS 132557 / TC161) TaxID=1328760 RepID=A0A165G1E5_XYLHT|nr:hypothetical protein L228DRAFT_156642 [Xylona heveae TC161]KZF21627.1 hypothetical protein L228DRAFT_156642 [Xylona heveae TC161]
MSSRPPPPHSQSTPPVLSSSPLTLPIHPGRAAPFPLSMAETQAAHFNPYALPATSGPAHSYARNPQPPAPVQLTELSIPPYPPRLQQQIQSSRPPLIPGSRPTPVSARYDRWPSVPLERILTDQPYASPPSGSATSQYGVTTSPTNSWTDQSTIRKAGERPLGESTPIILNRPVSLLAPELLARQPEQPFPSPDYTPRRGSVNSARGSGSVSTGLPPSLQPLPIFGSQNTSIKDP